MRLCAARPLFCLVLLRRPGRPEVREWSSAWPGVRIRTARRDWLHSCELLVCGWASLRSVRFGVVGPRRAGLPKAMISLSGCGSLRSVRLCVFGPSLAGVVNTMSSLTCRGSGRVFICRDFGDGSLAVRRGNGRLDDGGLSRAVEGPTGQRANTAFGPSRA